MTSHVPDGVLMEMSAEYMTCFTLEGLIIKLSWLGLCQLSPLSEWTLCCFALHIFRLPEHLIFFFFFTYLSLYRWNSVYVMSKACWVTGCSYLKYLNSRNPIFSPGQGKWWYRCPKNPCKMRKWPLDSLFGAASKELLTHKKPTGSLYPRNH